MEVVGFEPTSLIKGLDLQSSEPTNCSILPCYFAEKVGFEPTRVVNSEQFSRLWPPPVGLFFQLLYVQITALKMRRIQGSNLCSVQGNHTLAGKCHYHSANPPIIAGEPPALLQINRKYSPQNHSASLVT